MTQYLVACACGERVPVELGQAGQQVVCTCGATLDVPTLRQLTRLPTASVPSTTVAVDTSAGWSIRHGVIAAGLILSALTLAVAGWSWLTEPARPKFDFAKWDRLVLERLSAMTPAEGWQRWHEYYQPLADEGFAEQPDPLVERIRDEIQRRRFVQVVLLIVAGVCAVATAAVALWRR